MEQKVLKTNVYVNETIFSDNSEVPIDIDFTLPDYCPDISKIFKCQSVPRISSKSINGKILTVEGSVCITLIYCDKDGNLCSYEYMYPFSKEYELKGDVNEANVCCRIKNEYLNCRAVTSRKVGIHGAASVYIKVFCRKSHEIVSDYDDCNIELKRGMAQATVPMGYAEKYLIIEEDLPISSGQPAIRNIIRCDAVSCIKETKIVNNKAVVKGELSVCIIYCPENAKTPQSVKSVLPFSQIIDVEGLHDSCEIETKSEVAFFDIKPRISASGEAKSFALTAKLLLCTEAYCGNDIPVIYDAFSRKYNAQIKKSTVCFDKIKCNVRETYHCKKTLSFDEEISSIVDLWCNVQNSTAKFQGENMIICGTLVVGLILCDTDNNAIFSEKPIEFEYKYSLGCYYNAPHSNPQIEVVSCGFTITGASSIEVTANLNINAAVYEKRDITLISDVEIDENSPIDRTRKGALTIYFPNNNEYVWDIARIYNASVDEIMRINDLDNEKLPAGRMILVPIA